MANDELVSQETFPKQVEDELMEVLHERHREWTEASAGNSENARLKFLKALDAFNGLVMHGRMPGESVKAFSAQV